MMKHELLEMIALLERMRSLRDLWVDEPVIDPTMEMSLFLMKRHLMGLLTTPTSLAQSADVPYTTATRRVKNMQDLGLIDFRPRTQSGKSYSVHPSPKLISKLTSYLMAMREAMHTSAVTRGNFRTAKEPKSEARIIESPCIAPRKLGFRQGLNILVLDDPAYSLAKPLQAELSYLMGGKVQFFETSIDNLRAEVLTNSERRSSLFDVVAVDLPLITEFASKQVLTPLDVIAKCDNLDGSDFISAAWRGAVADQQQYAIPILINPQLLFYRKDLFEKQSFRPPSTSQDVLEAASYLHDPMEKQYGVSWTAAKGAPVGQAFIQFLADFGQPLFGFQYSDKDRVEKFQSHDSHLRIDTDRGHAAAKFMIELVKFSPPDVLKLGWNGQVDLLRAGKVAMCYEWASRAAQLAGFRASDELGFLPHPVGPVASNTQPRSGLAPIGGFAFGIPKNIAPERAKTAWNAIKWLSSPEVIKLLVQYGGHVTPRISVGADSDVQQVSPIFSAIDKMNKESQIRLWPRPPAINFSSIVEVLGEEIHAMLSGDQSISQALKRSQERAEDIQQS